MSLTNESEFWNRRREQLQEAVRKAALDLFAHTGSNRFRLPLDPPDQTLWVSAGPSDEPEQKDVINELPVNQTEALQLAQMQRDTSNLARCYLQLRGNLSLAEEGLASATQEIERLRAEVRALRIGHGFADPDSLDAPAHEPSAPRLIEDT